MFILLCFAIKLQYVNSIYTGIQAIHFLINILSAVKIQDAASSWESSHRSTVFNL